MALHFGVCQRVCWFLSLRFDSASDRLRQNAMMGDYTNAMAGVDTNHGGTLLFNYFQAVHFFVFQESFDIFGVFSYTFVYVFIISMSDYMLMIHILWKLTLV